MADVKITDLAADTNPASTDVLPFVDISADETKKVTIADLLENAGNGTASAPAFSFDSDPNTGMLRSGADALGFATGGTQRFVISSSGELKIGGTLPSSPDITLNANGTGTFTGQLTLEGLGTPFRFGTGDRGGQINLYQVGSISNGGIELEAVHTVGSEISFKTQGTRRITIDRDGDLLIGGTLPSSPNTNLSTDGSATFAGDIETTTAGDGVILKSSNGTRYRLTVANDGTLSTSAV